MAHEDYLSHEAFEASGEVSNMGTSNRAAPLTYALVKGRSEGHSRRR